MPSTLLVDSQWRIKDALDLIRTLQPHVKPFGFHICLGGGVLNTGASKKDLDLYFLSLDQGKTDADKLLAFLTETWGPSKPMGKAGKNRMEPYTDLNDRTQYRFATDPPSYPNPPDSPYSHKLQFTWSGLRIDVFVLGGKTSKPAEAPSSAPVEGLASPDLLTELLDAAAIGRTELSFGERLARSAASIRQMRTDPFSTWAARAEEFRLTNADSALYDIEIPIERGE